MIGLDTCLLQTDMPCRLYGIKEAANIFVMTDNKLAEMMRAFWQ